MASHDEEGWKSSISLACITSCHRDGEAKTLPRASAAAARAHVDGSGRIIALSEKNTKRLILVICLVLLVASQPS